MNKSSYSVRDHVETLWYFHRRLIQTWLAIDLIVSVLVFAVAGGSSVYLPVVLFPLLGVLNYWLSSRMMRQLHIELPLGFFVASAVATLIALVDLGATHSYRGLAASQIALTDMLANVVFFGMMAISLSSALGIYTLWTHSEMESQVRQARRDRHN